MKVDPFSINQKWLTCSATSWERLGCMPVEHYYCFEYAELFAVIVFGVNEVFPRFASVVYVHFGALNEYAHCVSSRKVAACDRYAVRKEGNMLAEEASSWYGVSDVQVFAGS